jgi:colicin import membrane protein
MVELWQPPAPVAEVPRVEPPEVKPPPKPEPVVEPPKPDIAVKAPPPPKAAAKPEVKPKPPAPPREDVLKRLREESAREQQALSVERERQSIKEQLQREQASVAAKAMADYAARIRGKIRGNIVPPVDIKGNPEAIFDVIQLPTGEVLSAKLRKSSGHRGYDEAVERAILKSSPLPRPDRPELFTRTLELRFRPLDP